jgi:hypothetical protein
MPRCDTVSIFLILQRLISTKENMFNGTPLAAPYADLSRNLIPEEAMKVKALISAAVLSLPLCTIATWVVPLMPGGFSVAQAQDLPKPPETKVTDGKVTGVGKETFSIEVQEDKTPKTIQFVVDQNTKIDGKIMVGLTAQVEYKVDGEKNIALHVIVTTAE